MPETFALYSLTWWVYIGCGLLFMFLVWWKARHWPFLVHVPFLTMLAAGAFSFTQVPNSDTVAPSVIAMILELENEGLEGETQLFIQLLLVWLTLNFVVIGGKYLWQYYQSQQKDAPGQHASQATKDSSPSSDSPPTTTDNQ